MNTKYNSSSELKTSEFARVRITSENYYVFNSRVENIIISVFSVNSRVENIIISVFSVNTKYISSSELKTSEFSRVRSTSENYYVFRCFRDEIYLVFTEKKQIFFLFYTMHRHFPMHKVGGENAKTKKF